MVAPPIFPAGYNIGDANSAFAEDPELSSMIRPSDVTGISKGYNNQALLLSEQEAKAEDNAMNYLRMALKKSPEVSPQQGWAAALLAAIPTFGGYLIGESVGPADIPEGFYGADLTKYATGGAQGGLQGAAVGASAAGGYLQGLEADQAQANDTYQKMAVVEANKAQRLGQQRATLENQQIARDDNQAFQRAMLDERNQASKELAAYKQEIKPEGFGAGDLGSEGEKLAFNRISSGNGLPEDYSILSPEAIKQANQNARSAAYAKSVTNTQGRFDTLQGYAQTADTVVIAPNGNDPKLGAKRAEIIGQRNMAKLASEELAASYDVTNGAFFGGDRKKEAGFASMLYSAARGLAGTGAQFSANEKPLVDALSAPNMTIDGFTSFLHDYLVIGDPAEQARTVGMVLDKAFNEKLKGTGQAFKEYSLPETSKIGGTMPQRGNYKTPQEYLNALKEYNNG